MRKSLLGVAALAVLAVAGCANNAGPPAPQLTFANYQTINLNVASAGVQDTFINPSDPQNVASQFVVPPAEAIRRYADNRFKANGMGDGFFTIAIEDARVHIRQIDQNNKVLEWSGVGKEDEYRVFIQLKVTPQPSGFSGRNGPTTIKMERTLIMPSSVTLAEREMKQVKFLEKLIADVDVKINDALDLVPAIRN